MASRQVRRPSGRHLPPTGIDFVLVEALGSILLLLATVAALVWANVVPGAYADVWATRVSVGVGTATVAQDLHGWVNDGLMAVCFFVVGLEIKRAVVRGELRDPRSALLPVVGALGGVLVPVFALANAGISLDGGALSRARRRPRPAPGGAPPWEDAGSSTLREGT